MTWHYPVFQYHVAEKLDFWPTPWYIQYLSAVYLESDETQHKMHLMYTMDDKGNR